MSDMNILAVVVTHNRRQLLARCLDHLQAQDGRVPAILVVNNASTDGTVEMLQALGVDCVTQENVGSAGGWHRGIQAALDGGYDAAWLMDDDGYPDPAALGVLSKALLPGVACASSVVLRENDTDRFVFPFPRLDAGGLPRIFAWPRKIAELAALRAIAANGTYPFVHLFNGALIRLDAVRQVGNVDRQYFIFGEEVDYFFRLRQAGTVLSVLDARHYHPDVSGRPLNQFRIYYYIKNTIILNQRYFNFPVLRNVLAVLAALGRTARRNGLLESLSYLFGRNASVLVSAIRRGLAGTKGRDFDG